MENSKIEISEDEFLYIMHGIDTLKREREETLLRREGTLKEIHKYKDGFEATVIEMIAKEEIEIKKAEDFKKEFILKYVKGQIK